MKKLSIFLILAAFTAIGLSGCKTTERTTTGIADEGGIITGNTTKDTSSKWRKFMDPTGKTVDLIPDW